MSILQSLGMGSLGLILGVVFSAHPAGATQSKAATQTALTVAADNSGARTKFTLTAHIAAVDASGSPAGVVTFRSSGAGAVDLGSAPVEGNGNATLTTDNLAAGDQRLVAVYSGDAGNDSSVSAIQPAHAEAAGLAGFTVTAAPTSLSTPAGGYVTSVVTVTPVNTFSGTVSLSCGGLPPSGSCTFSPTTVVVSCVAGAGGQEVCAPALSTMQIGTVAPSGTETISQASPAHKLPALAFVFPALFGLAGLGVRKNRALRNAALVLLVFTGTMAITACNPRYYYLNHGPTSNPGTAAGTYTIVINSLSAEGSDVIMPPTSPQLVLTVTAAPTSSASSTAAQ